MKTKTWRAKWLQDPRFDSRKPIEVFHRFMERDRKLPAIRAAHPPELRNVHFLVRKRFPLAAPVKTATLDITADDYYKLYVNGRFVGQGPAPAYPFRYFYNTWDIAPFLAPGENVIAIHVYYQGLNNNVWVSGDLRMGVVAEAAIAPATGRPFRLATDASWKARCSTAWPAGPSIVTIGYDTQVLEDIDARREDHGWRDRGFDDSAWPAPSARNPATRGYTFVTQPTPPLQISIVRPERIESFGRGNWRLDFGREITGQFAMAVHGRPGHTIEIRHAEELNPDGSIRYRMRCNCDYSERWTLSGRERDILEFYDYKGFRYVEVLGSPVPLDEANTWAVVRHHPWPEPAASSFECSDPVLNGIWAICANGVRGCSQENYVDCPTREKGQYFGDNTVASHAHVYLTGDSRLARHGIEGIAATRRLCPGLMSTGPCSSVHELADYCLQLPLQLEREYLWSGDRAFLRRLLPAAEHVIRYFARFENRLGLLETVNEKLNLVDWPRNLRDDYDFVLDDKKTGLAPGMHNVINAFYIGAIDTVSRLRRHLGKPGLSTAAKKRAFVRVFRSPETGLFLDAPGSPHSALHSNALALRFGLVRPADKPAVIEFLKRKRLSCGVYMSYFLLGGLFAGREDDFAFDLITGRDERSWYTMLTAGATACLEAWGPDQKWNTSFCHAWAAAPVPMLVEYVMGLNALRPGWDGLRFDPHTPRALKRARLGIVTPAGPVRTAFEQTHPGHVRYELWVPRGMKVSLPPGRRLNVKVQTLA